MPIIEITSLTASGVDMFSTLTEAQLRNRIEPDKGIFIVESPKVIRVALDAGYEPVALLCERKHIEGDAADIIHRCGDIPVYTGFPRTTCRVDRLYFDAWCPLCHAPPYPQKHQGSL
jgi:hypothetical protein